MLVIGGCAVVGASLGVTVWRLSQTRLIQRMRKKSGPEEDALADEGEETSEEQVAVAADETSSEEAEVTPVEAEAESEVEVAELADAEEG